VCDIDIRCRGSEAGPKCLPIDYSTGSRLLGYVTVKLRDTCNRYYQRFPAFVYTHYVSLSWKPRLLVTQLSISLVLLHRLSIFS